MKNGYMKLSDANAGDLRPLYVRNSNTIKKIDSDEVVYIQCDSSISDIHFRDGSIFTCTKHLNIFEDVLNKYGFIRINRQVLVNLKYVDEIKINDRRKHILILCNGTGFSISYRRWPTIKSQLG